MGRINRANLKKTIYYLKRNGVRNTWHAVWERLEERKAAPYSFVPVSEAELEKQRAWSADKNISFSIVVPTYRTNEIYLKEMIQSVVVQSYPRWELVLADATEDDGVKRAIDKITRDMVGCESIKYIKLTENAGIAANTNQALQHATGEYIGLLDHDDVLTPDALYEMALAIEEGRKQGRELQMLYSDEDKCNGDMTHYYEPNKKEKFNLDLLLSNNYICHFLVMKSELIKELGFRSEYDGAQDYDLVLRAAIRLGAAKRLTVGEREHALPIVHIPKVLYHWRCHTGSTAENPQSKQYAYDAGMRALQDFSDTMGYGAKAVALKHLGFYTLEYPEGALRARQELGALGGAVLGKSGPLSGQKIIGGRMSRDGKVYYEGLPVTHSGYLHRAVLTQKAEAVDIRCIQVREECRELFEQVVGVPYTEIKQDLIFDTNTLPANADYKALSLQLSRALREAGYEILYAPALRTSWKREV